MKHYRYGKFRFWDFTGSWFAILVYLTLAVGVLTLDIAPFLLIVPVLGMTIRLWTIISKLTELFSVIDGTILVTKGLRNDEIKIPDKCTIVLSAVDVCPSPLVARTAMGYQTHILKGKWAATILRPADVEMVLEELHRGYAKQYTTCMIEQRFYGHNHVYSFVCDEALLFEIRKTTKAVIVVSEAISKYLSTELVEAPDVFLDVGH